MIEKTINLFKVIVVGEGRKTIQPCLNGIKNGYVTNFVPVAKELAALNAAFSPIPVTTLFTVEERNTLDPFELISRQFLHYFEVYGLGMPGLFKLEVTNGVAIVLANIKGVTKTELGEIIRNLLYTNAPIRNVSDVVELINFYKIDYDLTKVANNEARILLYRDGDRFLNGDDAVRYIVYKTTDDSLLIKSEKVVQEVKNNASKISNAFLSDHEIVLAQVFNRHKRIIMALKKKANNTVINRISRLSKTKHVPIVEGINKTFVAKALTGDIEIANLVARLRCGITLRDKFKYLNLLEWRLLQRTDDVFVIRNGRAHLEDNRPISDEATILQVKAAVIYSITEDFKHLFGKNILLDLNVDYGLPISQKQMLGNLPFGTEICVSGDNISSGIYWKNEGGATDLDLSAVDANGQRTGWGSWSGYNRENPIAFSGDITSAPNGAMEFLTSSKNYMGLYGLYVNIFSGNVGAEAQLIVGEQTDKQWITNPVVREKFNLDSKQTILGFIRNGKFVVYKLRTSEARTSGGRLTEMLVSKGLASSWTISRILDAANVGYDIERVAGKSYDYDMSYDSFSVDKLEDMLLNRQVAKDVP